MLEKIETEEWVFLWFLWMREKNCHLFYNRIHIEPFFKKRREQVIHQRDEDISLLFCIFFILYSFTCSETNGWGPVPTCFFFFFFPEHQRLSSFVSNEEREHLPWHAPPLEKALLLAPLPFLCVAPSASSWNSQLYRKRHWWHGRRFFFLFFFSGDQSYMRLVRACHPGNQENGEQACSAWVCQSWALFDGKVHLWEQIVWTRWWWLSCFNHSTRC